MIASKPVRLLSLAIVALVVIVGVRGIIGGLAFGGDLDTPGGPDSADRGKRTAGVVAYVLDGDTVQVTTRDATYGCGSSVSFISQVWCRDWTCRAPWQRNLS